MGSHKKHKKESKKRKHRDRSRSGSVEEIVLEKEKKKHKKHKEKKKEKHLKRKSEESYESEEDDVILVPPPPKISRQETPPPPPVISGQVPPVPSPATRVAPRAPSPPRISSSSDQSLSIEETNRLRAKLGLKPLEVAPTPVPPPGKDEKPSKNLEGGTDMGEFVHKPADNIAQKMRSEKIKAKLTEKKEKRALEAKLAKVKKLADDSDDEDAAAWVARNRKITEERLKAEKRAKELDDLDAVFGVGELVEEEMRASRKDAYSARDLRGLKVEHDMSGFAEGRDVILTLKDKGVLDEEDDALVNVNMLDDEHHKKNIDRRKQKPYQYGYDAFEEEAEERNVLSKYDEEIDGEKKSSFKLGVSEAQKKEQVKTKLQQQKRVESLNMPTLQLAQDYYTEQEMVKFKKPKKKVRKIRERKKMLKADDLLADAPSSNTEDWLKDIGTRRTPQVNIKPDPDNFDIDSFDSQRRGSRHANSFVKDEPMDLDDPMDVDDLPAPLEDLSEVKVEPDDSELELALRKARKLKQKEAAEALPNPEKVAKLVSEESGYMEAGPGGSIVLNSTAEFCRTLGDIPTYGLAGNRDEDAQEMLDFEQEMKQEKLKEESSLKRSGWNDVEMDERLVDIAQYEAPILDAEPDLGVGVAGALRLAVSKGYLEKETGNRPSATRFAHLQAQNYSIEDKAHAEDDKFGRRDRYAGPTSDFKEKEGYKPNVKLDYIDDNGHLLCAKEAFRYLSHKFHGKGPAKNKVEKRMKKSEQEVLMKQMSSTDTPLGTLNMLQAKQKEMQSPFVVLSGNKQLQQATKLSKTKL